jgi:tetratricopeptide (TPR) repeat protein
MIDEDVRAHLCVAREEYAAAHFLQARQEIDAILALVPDQPEARSLADKIDAAVANVREMQCKAIIENSRILLKKGEYSQAIESLRRAAALLPNNAEAAQLLQQSIAEYTRLREEQQRREREDLMEELFHRATNLLENKRYSHAISTLSRVLEIDPGNERAQKLKEKAQRFLREAALPTVTRMYEEGLAAYSKGNVEKAVSLWRNCLELLPDFTDAQKALERAKINK